MDTARHLGLTALASLVALTGCATNAIRLDRAATLTSAGRTATDATRAFMETVRIENRESLVDLVAADPSCRLPQPLIAQGEVVDQTILCRTGPAQRADFTMPRLIRRDFAPSLAVIDGLVAYLDAIDAVLAREPIDIPGVVGDAQATLETISTIAGGSALSEEQTAAVAGALTLLNQIVDEAQRVDDLRRIELQQDQAAFAGSVDNLDAANRKWLRSMDAQLDNRRTLLERRLPRIPASDYDRRRAAAADLMMLIERQEALPELTAALAKTVQALRDSHTAYRDLLFGDGRLLTPKERKKAADLTRARLRGALNSLTAIIKAF